ncbi:MAG: hypothetical protein K0S39_2203 [Paenibacillus sp.]|nr:hypothetical protein [Paenibacillus sp.]
MIKEIILNNFRCYSSHTVPLKSTAIIVGKNNAGKSTIVEALRIISLVAQRYRNLTYNEPPKWTGHPKTLKGVSPSLKGMEINFESVFHRYGTPPASLKASFISGEEIEVLIGPEAEIFAVIYDAEGKSIKTKGQANLTTIPQVNILPQVAPLQREEKVLRTEYVIAALSSPLAPLHFRNQLLNYPDFYQKFKVLAESTWNGFRLRALEGSKIAHGEAVTLLVQDNDFVAEVGWMGHGLQMWLQTMWFLARASKDSTVILDEPDVYMHADLQRKLIRMIIGEYRQVIVATHSVEIMAEVEPESILVVDRSKPQSKFANTLPAVQRLIDSIGGIHNIQLARLWSSRKCLLIEGKDISILKHLHSTLFPDSTEQLEIIPNLPIGGWGGWNYAIGSSMLMKNAANESIRMYCLLDRDYHTSNEIEERLDVSEKRGVDLHIWGMKEIENYLIKPDTICRIINQTNRNSTKKVTSDLIINKIMEIADSLYDDTIDAIATEYYALDKAGIKKANTVAREIIKNHWNSYEDRIKILSGKLILSKLSAWSQQEYGVSFSNNRVARAMKRNEISPEMVKILTAIEYNTPFDKELKQNYA